MDADRAGRLVRVVRETIPGDCDRHWTLRITSDHLVLLEIATFGNIHAVTVKGTLRFRLPIT
jgi:hypothetical protein